MKDDNVPICPKCQEALNLSTAYGFAALRNAIGASVNYSGLIECRCGAVIEIEVSQDAEGFNCIQKGVKNERNQI